MGLLSLVSASKVDARLMAVAFKNMLKIGSLVGTRSQKLYISTALLERSQ